MEPPVAMLTRAVDQLPAAGALPGGCRYEPKWDGFRLLAETDDGGVHLWSRHGTDLTVRFPDIAAAASRLPDVTVDGEVVVWREGALDFAALQQRMTASASGFAELVRDLPAHYVIFDILAVGAGDARPLPWEGRRQLLERLPIEPPLTLTPVTADREEALRWFDDYASAGVEGIVAKGASQPYTGGHRGWLKVRHRRTTEAIVGAIEGTLEVPGRLVLGAWDDDGDLRVVGATPVVSASAVADVIPHLRLAGPDHPWPEELPGHLLSGLAGQRRTAIVQRVEPTTVVEIAVDTAFERGRWRHPVRFHRVRTDVTPDSVTTARIAGSPPEQPG